MGDNLKRGGVGRWGAAHSQITAIHWYVVGRVGLGPSLMYCRCGADTEDIYTFALIHTCIAYPLVSDTYQCMNFLIRLCPLQTKHLQHKHIQGSRGCTVMASFWFSFGRQFDPCRPLLGVGTLEALSVPS